MDRLRLELPCDLHYRNAVGALIQELCTGLERRWQEPALRHQVVSAFNEAFNNLAQHSRGPESIEIALEVEPRCLVIEIRDRGAPFDYAEVPPPNLDELPESGLGIFIMRSFMSEVRYRAGEDGENVLRMVRRPAEVRPG